MNPLAVLLPALNTALNTPPLQWAGVNVPATQQLNGNSEGHYVLIDQPTDTDGAGSPGCGRYSCTVLLDVVTQFEPGAVTGRVAEALVSQIHARLRGKALTLPAGWTCGLGRVEPTVQIKELDGEKYAVRRLVRYRWEIYSTL